MYDLIGDIHGHADELMQLLQRLGYQKQQGIFRHPERKVVFLGDFIDRGPQIRQVLEIVRPMVEAGAALSVMGNHELNAMAYHTPDPSRPGEFLRRHKPSNVHQHRQTILQLTSDELLSTLKWFRTLPMWLDLEEFRVVHACWDEQAISIVSRALEAETELTDSLLRSACRPGNELFDSVEIILKGKEAVLPEGIVLYDKDGHIRTKTRVRWYLSPEGHSYRSYALTDKIDCDAQFESSQMDAPAPYPATAKPVFVGHYWMQGERPEILTNNVACLDFSVAKGGFLCAYRWQGEQKLSNENFVWVNGCH